jgi:hypothetical protein
MGGRSVPASLWGCYTHASYYYVRCTSSSSRARGRSCTTKWDPTDPRGPYVIQSGLPANGREIMVMIFLASVYIYI